MTIALDTFLSQVNNLVPDLNASEMTTISRYQQIKAAVRDYSHRRPDTQTTDVTGDGGRYYPINASNFAYWSDEFSTISAIEYPAQAVSSDEYPVYLDTEDWRQDYYDSSNVRYLFLPNHAPAATETMRITYTAPYQWSVIGNATSVAQASHGFSANDYVYQNSGGSWVSAGSTPDLLATHQVTAVADSGIFSVKILAVGIPESDFFTVCNKAACLVCLALAARYSQTNTSTFAADSVNHITRAQEYRAQANRYCDAYMLALGLDPTGKSGPPGASAWVDLDTRPEYPWMRRRWLFHGDD